MSGEPTCKRHLRLESWRVPASLRGLNPTPLRALAPQPPVVIAGFVGMLPSRSTKTVLNGSPR